MIAAPPDQPDPTTDWTEPPGIGRALGIGVAIGVTVSFAAVFAALLVDGQSVAAAAGMGAFVAIWGGLGFGGMMGGVVWAVRLEEQQAEERRIELPSGPMA